MFVVRLSDNSACVFARTDLFCMIDRCGTSSDTRLLIVDQFNESDISTQQSSLCHVIHSPGGRSGVKKQEVIVRCD